MEIIKHFSHDHPLVFSEHVEDEKPYFCSICGVVVILSSPSYKCSINDCNFFLHKPCTTLLPQELSYPGLCTVTRYGSNLVSIREKDTHPLSLQPNAPSSITSSRATHRHFSYICNDCKKFEVHPLRARPVEIKIKHESHQSHPLVLASGAKEICCKCDVCGEKQEGVFFYCKDCDFWIHQDCILLSRVIKIRSHPHPLFLAYSLADQYYDDCGICDTTVQTNGRYFGSQCRYFVHIKCAGLNIETSEIKAELMQLPDDGDTFPSSTIRALVETEAIPHQKDGNNNNLTVEKYHNHGLVFHSKEDHFLTSSNSEECLFQELVVCNACIQPISSPFYKCRKPDCHFIVHNFCAKLPSTSTPTDLPNLEGLLMDLVLPELISKHFFFSVFPCVICQRPCNGCSYGAEDPDDYFGTGVECYSAPRTIKHASHGKHVLVQTGGDPKSKFSCCDKRGLVLSSYRCVSCNQFRLHIECALLPKRARHKFDKHPLELNMSSSSTTQWNKKDDNNKNDDEYCFCEFCEKGIDKRCWFYHCAKCDQFFHVKCIPSVGYLSKVKFGGALNISGHHDHPVNLTRMLMEGSHRCGYCKQIIEGFVDDMAFNCSKCDFWIHFKCARDCDSDDGTPQPRLFSDRLKEWEEEAAEFS